MLTRQVGEGNKTAIHGVGDGAPWIVTRLGEQFRQRDTYTVDLFRVCEYLAAVAPVASESKAYVRAMNALLLENRGAEVIAELRCRLEPPETAEEQAPVRAASRYLENRPDQLDYQSAKKRGLPVGSGMIESGHKHILQARLKIAGASWHRHNAERIAKLRVHRANLFASGSNN
jgi:hypothetical protein